MPVQAKTPPLLPGLSPIGGKPVIARFDGGHLSSDGGLLVLREVEQRLDLARRLAACIVDPRAPERVVHGLDEIIRTRMLIISSGYEDGNHADRLRRDPMFKLAMGRLPDDADLCSQPTISRLENLPDARALLRMGGLWSTTTARASAKVAGFEEARIVQITSASPALPVCRPASPAGFAMSGLHRSRLDARTIA